MLERDTSGRPTLGSAPASAYERKLLRLALLAPALQDDILAGRQPRRFRLETFLRSAVPLAWKAQRAALGWPPSRPPATGAHMPVIANNAPVTAD